MAPKSIPVADRFWPKVDKNGPVPAHRPELGPCWLWIAGRLPAGYGLFWQDRHERSAHRVAWELANGPIPAALFVMHRCDNPPCVNPAHLLLGTPTDNMQDKISKGRAVHPIGSRSGSAKLTETSVVEIRAALRDGSVRASLAAAYGVSLRTISNIALRETWRHVE